VKSGRRNFCLKKEISLRSAPNKYCYTYHGETQLTQKKNSCSTIGAGVLLIGVFGHAGVYMVATSGVYVSPRIVFCFSYVK
jgi:hypothetical protein